MWITTDEAAEQSGYTKDWISRMAKIASFKAEKKGGRWWIDREDFMQWVREQRGTQNGRYGPK
jgi:excisionase family DNA binding protein